MLKKVVGDYPVGFSGTGRQDGLIVGYVLERQLISPGQWVIRATNEAHRIFPGAPDLEAFHDPIVERNPGERGVMLVQLLEHLLGLEKLQVEGQFRFGLLKGPQPFGQVMEANMVAGDQ